METRFAYQGKDVLEVMSKCAVNRNNAIEKLIVDNFRLNKLERPGTILEFGAGKGEFIDRFKKFTNLTTHAVEIDREYMQTLSRNHIVHASLEELHAGMDFIFTIDVLEHIQDDERILSSMFMKLNRGGKLLIYVPARPELYSRFDAAIGHVRRYRLEELKQKVLKAGFEIFFAKYHDFLGYFAALINKLTTDGTLKQKPVKIYDTILVPITTAIESILSPPIGKDIMILAGKPR